MFGSLISAMVTPFDEQGQIDYEVVEQLIKASEEQGHSALLIAGSTGEGHALSLSEKKALFQFVKAHTDLPLLYSLSHNSLPPMEAEMMEMEKEEPDGYLVVVPYYNRPPQRGIYLFFKTIASWTKRPIILYNVPSRTSSSLEFATIRKLIRTCPNIIGMKEAGNDWNLFTLLKRNFPQFRCYCGSDEHYYQALKSGADGLISVMSVLYGKELAELRHDYHEGYHNVLLDDYLRLVAQLLSVETNPIPIKYLLSARGYRSMNLRLPLVSLALEGQRQIDMLL